MHDLQIGFPTSFVIHIPKRQCTFDIFLASVEFTENREIEKMREVIPLFKFLGTDHTFCFVSIYSGPTSNESSMLVGL